MKSFLRVFCIFAIISACAKETVIAPEPNCTSSITSKLSLNNGNLTKLEYLSITETYSYRDSVVVHKTYQNDTLLRNSHYYYMQNDVALYSLDTQFTSNNGFEIIYNHYEYTNGQMTKWSTYTIVSQDTNFQDEALYSYYTNGRLESIEIENPGLFDASYSIVFNYGTEQNPKTIFRQYYHPLLGITTNVLPESAIVNEAFKEEYEAVYTYTFNSNNQLTRIMTYHPEGSSSIFDCEYFEY